MSSSLSKTFDVLASSRDQQAVDVLVSALDMPNEATRTFSLKSLLKRHSPRGHVEIIRRLNTFSPAMRSVINSASSTLRQAIKHCLAHGDSDLRKNTLDVLREGERFEQLPSLLELLTDDQADTYEMTLETFQNLVNRLYENLDNDKRREVSSLQRANADRVRDDVLGQLHAACSEPTRFSDTQVIIEAVLVLGSSEHFAVKHLLWQANPTCRELAGSLLLTSRHPGVMHLVLDFMSQNYPHPKAFEAIAIRDDMEFVTHFLRWLPEQLSRVQAANLRQVKSVCWLDDPYRLPLSLIPDALQPALVAVIRATGLPKDNRMTLQQWVLRHGSAEGREAASDNLALLDDGTVQEIFFDALENEDPNIQAWATRHVRDQGIPDAFAVLIERLDSPIRPVQEAARRELHNFNIDRILSLFEHLDSKTCIRAGQLIQKIDPNALQKLRRELAHPVQWRRIRAARGAQAMNLHSQIASAFVAMLKDDVALVRRTAIDVLGTIPTDASIQALKNMASDPSVRVREAVAKALARLCKTPHAAVVSTPR